MIKDSGERRSFDTGAVRDIQAGKGRPWLMPTEVLHTLTGGDEVVLCLHYFKDTGSTLHLYHALRYFADKAYGGCVETMLLDVAIHFEEGAQKYGDNNWQKGIPVECYMDSAIRHYLKYRRGDTDEPHNRAFVWNLMCCIWEVEYRYD